MLGGREFDPTDFFKKDDGFNKYMMASESLVMEELPFGLDMASRLLLSEKIKKLVASDSQTYHPKGRDAMTMHPHFRLSLSINDNPEKLRALPPMANDLTDKVLVLKVRGGSPMPMPTNTDEEEAAFAAAVKAQLPAFVHWLLREWEPPAELSVGRFGMQAWQHPEITDALWEQEPSNRFAFLLDKELFPDQDAKGLPEWETWGWAKAIELESQLKGETAKHSKEFCGMFKSSGYCAQLLGQLFKRESEQLGYSLRMKPEEVPDEHEGRRYRKRHTRKDGNFWQVIPPPK